MAASLMAFFFYLLASMGFSIGADNIGDSFSDLISKQDPATQVMIQDFLTDPGSALFQYSALGSVYLSADVYSLFQDMQQNGVSTEKLNEMGIDYSKWFSNNKQNITSRPVGSLSYKISNDIGQSVVIQWVYDIDAYNNYKYDQYRLTVFVYNPDGSLNQVVYPGYAIVGMNGLTAKERAEIFVQNSFYTQNDFAYHVVNDKGNNFYTLYLENYIATDVALDGSPVYDNEYAPIGTVTIDGQPYNLNPDGSVTIDGTTYYPNSDGTLTVNDHTYTPYIDFSAYNDTALLDLLRLILRLLEELDYPLDWEKDNTYDGTTSLDVAYTGTLSEFIYSGPWTTVFPFCLPWDLYRGIKLLSSAPEAPKFVIPFNIPAFGLFKGYSSEIVLDFTTYYKYFYVSRWFTTVIFVASLIFITFKIVKGAR